jgi:GT2 family glycosyltransferase
VVVCNDDGAWIQAIREEFPFVQVHREPGRGPAAARNTGVRLSTGDVIAFLDSDCAAETGWLTQGVAALRAQGPLAVMAGDIVRNYHKRGSRSMIEAYDAVTFLQQERYVSAQRAVSANLFVSRELFRRVGGFDESFDGGAGEDWDWTERAVASGAVISFCAGARVLHPALRSWSALRRKVERIEAGNRRRRQKGARDAARPDRSALVWRIRRLAFDPRLSLRERVAAIGIHCVAWWWGIRAWRVNAPLTPDSGPGH